MRAAIIIILLILVVIAGFLFIGNGSDESEMAISDEQEETLDRAPDFSFVDYDENVVSNTDFEGKVLVVNSWAVWCPFCVDELLDFAHLQEEFGDDIAVVAINRGESKEKAKGFSDSLNISDEITFLLDVEDSFYREIGGFSMPETLFVNTDGNIAVHKRGFMTLDEMREHTETALGI